MRVQEHHTLEELKQLAAEHRGSIFGIRLQAVILARNGKTAAAVGEALGFCPKAVILWISHYNRQGLDGLVEHHSPGRPCSLSPRQLEELQVRLNQGPRPEDGVTSLRGRDIQRIIQEHFGVLYSLDNIYNLLHRLGYSYLKPRPRHEKANPEAQETFKKRFCRKSSQKFKPSIPIKL